MFWSRSRSMAWHHGPAQQGKAIGILRSGTTGTGFAFLVLEGDGPVLSAKTTWPPAGTSLAALKIRPRPLESGPIICERRQKGRHEVAGSFLDEDLRPLVSTAKS